MQSFSQVVASVLKQKKMTRKELAQKTGYSNQYIGELLLGQKRWNETSMAKVSAALNIKIEFVPETLSKTGT